MVLRMDWARYLAQLPAVPKALAGMAPQVESAPSSAGPPLLVRLDQAPPVRRLPVLVGHVLDRAIRVLGLAADYPLDVHEGLRNVGLDSLLAIELRNLLQSDAGVPLPVTLAFDYPTSDAIARHLADLLKLELGTQLASADPHPDLLADVQDLSDVEVEALLADELAGLAEARERRS
jgi:hypothetical protein